MKRRSYRQCCGIAQALDVVGERWTLLIVRDLLTGPKRFKDLLDGLSGIGTNLLAARMKELEGQGVVRRATLPPPAGTRVYELTELGHELEPVILALCRWGTRLLDEEREEGGVRPVRPVWAAMALCSALKPDVEVRETYELRVDEETFHVRVEDGNAGLRYGSASEPDLVVSGSGETILSLAAGKLKLEEAIKSGAVQVQGDSGAARRCLGSSRASAA
jgi:DNA-binding HxlR family transcriptional regulator